MMHGFFDALLSGFIGAMSYDIVGRLFERRKARRSKS